MEGMMKTCVPIIIGALITILPMAVEKYIDRKNIIEEQKHKDKQDMYIELISLFSKVLKNQCNSTELDLLRNRINLISVTGSVEVVKALNEYIDTWGNSNAEEQNNKYCNLLKVIRVDLGVDKSINDNFPQIGLRDISVKNSL